MMTGPFLSQHSRPRFSWATSSRMAALCVAMVSLWAAAIGHAQDVRMRLSDRETWVGIPVVMGIEFVNEDPVEPPQIPAVDGLKIESAGAPSRSSRISIIGGRRTESRSTIYTYRITPVREGTFIIPSFEIKMPSGKRKTEPVRIVATRSETDDLVFAEVDGDRERVYVGQALPVTLKIWIRPYADRDLNVKLSPRDMFGLISDQSEWGVFQETLEKAQEGQASIRSSKVLRKDSQGREHEYYLYEIDASLYPTKPGKLDMGDVRIIVQYPTQLGRARDPFDSFFDDSFFGGRSPFDDLFKDMGGFGARLAIADWRPIVVTPETDSTEVLPIPTANRPADYRGAVGQYRIATTATPTKVKVGDPIQLKIGIQGTGPMELVQAPPLDQLPSLTDGFKVPSGPLAGIVEGDIKVFETSIRPQRDDVTEIPPIPFSFFDPESGEFKTVYSDPIGIDVSPAEKLDLDSIVSQSPRGKGGADASSDQVGPALDIYTGSEVIQVVDRRRSVNAFWGWFAIPPVLVGLYYLLVGRERQSSGGGLTRRAALKRIATAERAEQIGQALLAWVASRLRLGRATLTRREAVLKLTGALDSDVLERLDRCLSECEQAAFAGEDTPNLSQLKREARELVAAVSRMRIPRSAPKTATWLNPTVAWHSLLVLLLLSGAVWTWTMGAAVDAPNDSVASTPSSTVPLTGEQVKILFDEANERYQQAMDLKNQHPSEAVAQFEKAAEKYELLIDHGIENAELFFNAGNAWFNAGRNGRAIANYERGLKRNPLDTKLWRNLSWARQAVQKESHETNSWNSQRAIALGIEWLQRIPTQVWMTLLVVAWALLWAGIWLHQLQWHGLERWLATASVLMAALVVSTASWVHHGHLPTARAIVVSRTLPVFPRIGPEEEPLDQIEVREGEAVQVLQRHGEWIQIETPSGTRGWTREGYVETV